MLIRMVWSFLSGQGLEGVLIGLTILLTIFTILVSLDSLIYYLVTKITKIEDYNYVRSFKMNFIVDFIMLFVYSFILDIFFYSKLSLFFGYYALFTANSITLIILGVLKYFFGTKYFNIEEKKSLYTALIYVLTVVMIIIILFVLNCIFYGCYYEIPFMKHIIIIRKGAIYK